MAQSRSSTMKREKRVRVNFFFAKDFDRSTKFSEGELDKLKTDFSRKTGLYPVKVSQKVVTRFVAREPDPEKDRVALTGKIQR